MINSERQEGIPMNSVPNSIVLMFILGGQGGTIHQVARELNCNPSDIANADYGRMEELMRQAQSIKMPYIFDAGWNAALEKASIAFGDQAADQAGYNIAEQLREWRKNV